MMKLAMVGISQETIIVMQIDAVMLNSPAGGGPQASISCDSIHPTFAALFL